MKLKRRILGKRAQIGETITWIVATVIIILIVIFSIFVVGLVRKDKRFYFSCPRDLLVAKSLSGFLLTENDSEVRVFEQIISEGDLNEFNAPLSVKIFKELYKEDYSAIDVDLRGLQPTLLRQNVEEKYYPGSVSSATTEERIYLHKDKNEYLGVFLSYPTKCGQES